MAVVWESYDLVEFVTSGVSCLIWEMDDTRGALRWYKFNARVGSFIFLNCQAIVLNHIKQIMRVRAIWDFLNAMYLCVTPMKRSLKVQLCCLDPALLTSICEHINKMRNFQQDMLHVGKEILSKIWS